MRRGGTIFRWRDVIGHVLVKTNCESTSVNQLQLTIKREDNRLTILIT